MWTCTSCFSWRTICRKPSGTVALLKIPITCPLTTAESERNFNTEEKTFLSCNVNDISSSLHTDILLWRKWLRREVKKNTCLEATTPSSCSQVTDRQSLDGVSTQLKVELPKTVERGTISLTTMRVPESQLNACEQSSAIFKPNVLRWAHLSANGMGVKDSEKTKVQYVECKLKHQEKNKKQDVTSSTIKNRLSYKVCIHHKVPLRFISSAVFLDKTLCVPLVELVDGMRNIKPTLHTSVLTCRLGVPSGCKSTTDKRLLAKTNEGYGRSEVDMRSPLSKHQSNKIDHLAPECGFNSEADVSDMQKSSTFFGLLSFRGPTISNTKTRKQKANGGKAALSAQINFRHGQHAFRFGPANSATWSLQAGRKETEEEQEDGKSSEHQRVSTCHHCCRLKDDSVGSSPNTLSLKEALELFRPDFISRSQGRVKKLEQRARRRKALQGSNLDLLQGLKEDQRKQKRNCTTPDPLSDNLFKPRERSISGREMQLRSRRIYNKLPEVTKKKEEEKRRAVSQSNRLRAEVFKKRLLDQILQR